MTFVRLYELLVILSKQNYTVSDHSLQFTGHNYSQTPVRESDSPIRENFAEIPEKRFLLKFDCRVYLVLVLEGNT